MKPYTATGRRGKVNVRQFRKAMTHAVDVDGLVWKFFSSGVDADAYAAEKSAEGYDAVVVPAEPYVSPDDDSADPLESLHSPTVQRAPTSSTLSRRLLGLLEARGYSDEEFEDALREEGVVMAAEIARRLLDGTGAPPSDSTIDALSRVFEVEPDYFVVEDSGIEQGIDVRDEHTPVATPYNAPPTQVEPDAEPPAGTAGYKVPMQGVGRLIRGLSDAADRCLQGSSTDVLPATRLTRAIWSVSNELRNAVGDEVLIPLELLEEIVVAWARAHPSDSDTREEYLWAAALLGQRPSA
ncbi:hypothetical protein ACFQWH_09365 [Mycolicibacterium sp. GCM10028919]|uniref:hypothetical protein n=1 Tax=Mycolicibacterium sp. GCM10028919 TaxID=3273401 RepID=UPI003609A220